MDKRPGARMSGRLGSGELHRDGLWELRFSHFPQQHEQGVLFLRVETVEQPGGVQPRSSASHSSCPCSVSARVRLRPSAG